MGQSAGFIDRGFQVRDAAGNLVRLTGIASDITERKQIEEVLQRQQTELRVLFDLTPAMICFKDTKNRILRVNQTICGNDREICRGDRRKTGRAKFIRKKRPSFMWMIWK